MAELGLAEEGEEHLDRLDDKRIGIKENIVEKGLFL